MGDFLLDDTRLFVQQIETIQTVAKTKYTLGSLRSARLLSRLITNLLSWHFLLIFWTLVQEIFRIYFSDSFCSFLIPQYQRYSRYTSVADFAHFLDPSTSEIHDLLQWQFLLISQTLVPEIFTIYFSVTFCSFVGPQYLRSNAIFTNLLLWHFLLICTLVSTK